MNNLIKHKFDARKSVYMYGLEVIPQLKHTNSQS